MVVLGQPDLFSNTSNNTPGAPGTRSAQSFNFPTYATVINGRLFVTDGASTGFGRILVWNSIPTTNQQPADVVICQPNMGASNTGHSLSGFTYPASVSSYRTHLFVTDFYNHRVVGWNSIPTVSGQSADFVIGQSSVVGNTPNNGAGAGSPSAIGFQKPQNSLVVGSNLIVSDGSNNRVLIFSPIPTGNVGANIVLGQTSMNANTANMGLGSPTPQTLSDPVGLLFINNHFVIADFSNNRVLIWNSFPTQNGQPADLVLGQPNMYFGTCNSNGISATSLCNPYGVSSDGTRLFVSDYGNARILIWNSFPTVNDQPADVVIGQSNMGSVTSILNGIYLNSPGMIYQNEGVFGVKTPFGY